MALFFPLLIFRSGLIDLVPAAIIALSFVSVTLLRQMVSQIVTGPERERMPYVARILVGSLLQVIAACPRHPTHSDLGASQPITVT